MRHIHFSAAAIMLMAAVSALRGDVLQVPDDYPTIQEALNSLGEGDTVLVAPGTYIEALQAPGYTFTLKGDVDSSGVRPVVDPSLMPGSPSYACLRLVLSSRVVIEDMAFRNGPEMYPRAGLFAYGGIVNRSEGLTVNRCTFDSTYLGLYRPDGDGTLSVNDCQFLHNVRSCLFDDGDSAKVVRNSSFSGSGPRLMTLVNRATVENCTFSNFTGGEWMWLLGDSTAIRGCTFTGPTPDLSWCVLLTDTKVCEDNLFQDISVFGATVQFSLATPDSCWFRRNTFRRCSGVYAQAAGGGIQLGGGNDFEHNFVGVDDCVFDSCTAASEIAFGAVSFSDMNVALTGNVHTGHGTPAPAVRAVHSPWTVMRDCSFDNTGIALRCNLNNLPADAELNWWGDASGPFHTELNPVGLGDTVIGLVDFEPWLTDSVLSVPRPPIAVPSDLAFTAMPNPFNPVTALAFTLSSAQHVRLTLHDVTGREVVVLADWPLTAGEHRISWDASGLPAGVYFSRLTTAGKARTVKLILLR